MQKNKTYKGLIWSFADNILQQLVNFIIGILLARLLLPEEFGVLGIISVFIAVSNTFVNSGLSDALINKRDADEVDYNTVFWTNVALGILVYLLLFFLAPAIASFFEQSSLISLIRITAISIVLVSFSSIQRTILTKELDFRKITIVSIIAVIISGIVSVTMALEGYGVLSLVVRMVVGQVITLGLFWILNKWRPSFVFSVRSFKELYKFGLGLLLSRILNTIYDNLYYLVIGKFLNATTLGFYSRADTFKTLATTNIVNTVQRVSFSVLSAETVPLSRSLLFKRFISGTFLITCLAITILFVNAREIILLLVGQKWAPSILYLQIISVSGLFLPLYVLNMNYLAVNRKTRLYFKIEVFTKLFAIPTIMVGIFFGLVNMLYGVVISSFLAYLVTIYYSYKLFNFSIKDQLSLVAKGLLLFCLSAAASQIISSHPSLGIYQALGLKLSIISSVFVVGSFWLFPDVVKELKNFRR